MLLARLNSPPQFALVSSLKHYVHAFIHSYIHVFIKACQNASVCGRQLSVARFARHVTLEMHTGILNTAGTILNRMEKFRV